MTLAKRNRFYKRFFLTKAESIPIDSEQWKKLKIVDVDDNVISNKLELPTNLTTFVISNDSDDFIIEYSFDGRNLDGELWCDDGPFSQDCASEGYIYFRLPENSNVGPNDKIQVRVWGWRGGAGK